MATLSNDDAPAKSRADGSPSAIAGCILCGSERHRTLFRKDGYDFVRCADCSLVRLAPVPTEDELARVYEESYDSGAYAEFGAADDIRRLHAATRFDLVAPHAPEGRWLDLGCSTGAFLEAASQKGIDIEGIDVSPSAVAQATARGQRAFHAAAETFEPERPYAYITGFDVLEHVPQPGALLDRLHEWLAPGGRIALTVPDIRSVQARIMGRHWYYYSAPFHITYFHRATVTRLMEQHRFWPIVLTSAPKVMTLDYITTQLGTFNPWLHRVAEATGRIVPDPIWRRVLPIPTGELLVVASA